MLVPDSIFNCLDCLCAFLGHARLILATLACAVSESFGRAPPAAAIPWAMWRFDRAASGPRFETNDTFRRMYEDAEQGLLPIRWDTLGLGGTFWAEPIEALAAEQLRENVDRAASLELRLILGQHISRAFFPERWERFLESEDELDAARQKALLRRSEQARHYGMLVCRAFFEVTAAEHLAKEKAALKLSPPILTLIDQFLKGDHF